ncbi:membrane protein insertion efficiency factor YidD [Planctomycetota bacterium]|nr:membrane protein insertion efficiency factor YidD [Planctomycetota bacterium]
MIKLFNNLIAAILIFMVMIYRFTLSPFLGRHCRYHPTCSQYMIDAIKKYGPYRGTLKGIKRIFRCHPFSKHDHYDPA